MSSCRLSRRQNATASEITVGLLFGLDQQLTDFGVRKLGVEFRKHPDTQLMLGLRID